MLYFSVWKSSISEESAEKVVFVSVHVRRTDYMNHMNIVNGAPLINERFFDKAFEICRERYNSVGRKVIFLATSDDNNWIKVNKRSLLSKISKCFSQENFEKHPDVRFAYKYSDANMKKEDFAGFDLCVLASSDHSIFDYGSFGMWGALLAGGDVIVSKGKV